MICVVEPVCKNAEHASFNAALLESAIELSKDDKVIFLSDPSHHVPVTHCLSTGHFDAVTFQSAVTADRHLRALIPRFRIEWPLVARAWAVAKSSKSEMLIFTGVTEAGLLAIKLFFLLHKPSIPVIIIFHSILPQFLYSFKRRLLLGARVRKQIGQVVLGRHILIELAHLSSWIAGGMHVITHPYIFDQHGASRSDLSIRPKFGFLGLGSPGKGFVDFLTLITGMPVAEQNHSPGFYFIGSVAGECAVAFEQFKRSDRATNLWYPTVSGKLPADIYRNKIAEVDYLVMPHRPDAYKLIFSGSSLDSLLHLKPIIARRSQFFETLFEKLGDVGYLYDSLEDLACLIAELIQHPPRERYEAQVSNLRNGRIYFDPKIVSEEIEALSSALRH